MIKDIYQGLNLNVTFNTTEDCNLACKYCYEINKKPRVLRLDTAKKFIDLLLSDDSLPDIFEEDSRKIQCREGIVLDFIGGDSLMNVGLLDSIVMYWIKQVNTVHTKNAHSWRNNWRLSVSTNGTLFEKKEVRDFCEKYKNVLSLGVSIDGCPAVHDMNRVFKDGTGSMPAILKNWNWYQKTFPLDGKSTKSTCSRTSIPYLYESLVFMHEKLGLKYIHQNFIMENTYCTQDDYEELKRQMQKCIEYVFEHRKELYWSMIDRDQFARHHNSRDCREEWNTGRCGGGGMPALGISGNIYPCFRFLPHTLEDYTASKDVCVGNVDEGFSHKENFSKVLNGAKRCNCTKDPECLKCEYESACAYCIGGCYSEFKEFRRTTYICEITKIQCEYAKKYWKMAEAAAN